ncbi:unnamed protein product [Amaranthus hypochondriacus]
MKNNSISASSHHIKTQKTQQQNPRSPLKVKDFNISSSTSIEAPRGCLRFFLSHHSSNVSKIVSNRRPKSYVSDKTPKSAPNIRNLKGGLSFNGGNLDNNCNNVQNPEKPLSRNSQRLKKNPSPSLCLWKSGKKSCSKSHHLCKFSADSDNKFSENTVNFTPVNKTVNLGKKDPNSSDKSSPIPAIQVSVSPEINGGSNSIAKLTPTTCYAAGHVLSGVSDKRKCRPSGLLTIGDNNLFGSSKTMVFDSKDENVIGTHKSRSRVSPVPSPEDASIHWISSPCDEEHKIGIKLNKDELSMDSSLLCSSSSSLGFSSELGSKSNSGVTDSDATTVSRVSGSKSSEFRTHQWPSFGPTVRSPSPASPNVTSFMIEASPEHEGESPRCLDDSIGSGNVIRTPQSSSSSQSFGFSHMSRDEISRLWFECELNSVTEVLRRVSLSPECELPKTSFEFNPLIKPDSSIDFATFQKAFDNPIFPDVPEVRISWREGLVNRIFEMDELDCCRCFSDEEDDANDRNDPYESFTCREVVDFDSDTIENSSREPINLENEEKLISEEGTTSVSFEFDNGDDIPDVVKDSSWRVCENQLFKV